VDALNGHNFDEDHEGNFGRGMMIGGCAGIAVWTMIIVSMFLLLGCQAPMRF
jgi:hypothetical protein